MAGYFDQLPSSAAQTVRQLCGSPSRALVTFTSGMDREIFLWINHWPEWLAPPFKFLSEALNHWPGRLILLAYIVWMLVRGRKERFAILFSLTACALANTATNMWKTYWPMHRPFQPEELGSLVHLRVGYASSMGTASAHAANMAAIATIMFLISPKDSRYWIPIAFLVGLSRIYNGAHYPWQVLLGWTTGAVIAAAVGLLARKFLPNLFETNPAEA